MATVSELVDALQTGTSELRSALQELQERAIERVNTKRDYERESSLAYLKTEGTVKEREAKTLLSPLNIGPLDVLDLKYEAEMAEAKEKSASKAVDAHRTVLSAIQSIAKLSAAEADLYGKGPSEL